MKFLGMAVKASHITRISNIPFIRRDTYGDCMVRNHLRPALLLCMVFYLMDRLRRAFDDIALTALWPAHTLYPLGTDHITVQQHTARQHWGNGRQPYRLYHLPRLCSKGCGHNHTTL